MSIPISIPASAEKSKSKRNNRKSIDKRALWAAFDTNIIQTNHTNVNADAEKTTTPLECLCDNTNPNKDQCTQCGAALSITDEGFRACSSATCGVLYTNTLDNSPEWRYYGGEDAPHGPDPTRCGMPTNPLLQESSYGCCILTTGRSSHAMRKIRQYTEWQSVPYHEKALYADFQKITTFAGNAGYQKKIIDDALYNFKRLSEYDQSFRGDNKDGIVVGAMSIACKVNGCPRTPKELAAAFHVDATTATTGCKHANLILAQLERGMSDADKTTFSKTTPDVFIERFCSKLNINAELTHLCRFVAIKVDKLNIMSENTPNSIAVGVVYFVAKTCNLPISKYDIHRVCDISEVTINKCCSKLEKMSADLVPPVILQRYAVTD
jgi:transcription initiation factor TFIIIB Brf1 subunit/transcription initiation factor TFIIB